MSEILKVFGSVLMQLPRLYQMGMHPKLGRNLMVSTSKHISNAKTHELEQQFNFCPLSKEITKPDEWFAVLKKIKLQLLWDFKEEFKDENIISHIV